MMAFSDLAAKIEKIGDNKIVLSNSDADRSASVIISDGSIINISPTSISGICIEDSGVTIQGDLFITGHGTTIKKGNYSENPDSAKMFTYPETIQFESAAKEAVYKAAGEAIGANLSDINVDGFMPIITDLGGSIPILYHTHSISMKHTHRIEPSYLYRMPKYIKMFADFIGYFSDFIKA